MIGVDLHSKCVIRIDLDFVNHYKLGHFDEPQELESEVSVKELKALVAFPELLKILTNTEDESIKISTVLFSLEDCGFKKGPRVDDMYKQLKEAFDKQP
ncbi:hypothetical protein PULV_a3916 [Pseudoalteromonas ulvae UL12]|nr:hypothetical protein [Pseudoalteromonas ulvae UL12]